MIPDFIPGRHRELAKSGLCQRVWAWLNQPDIRCHLITPCHMKERPSVEGITKMILEEFPELASMAKSERDPLAQCFGAMVKQVLASVGYQHNRYGVKVLTPGFFSFGSTYVRAD